MARQTHLTFNWTVILACLLCSACSDAETSRNALQVADPNAKTAEPSVPSLAVKTTGLPKLALLGDSIALGKYLSAQQAFPSVVERQLPGRFVLVNASVAEDTTEDGLRRIDWLLKQSPEIVIVELGENDKRLAVPVTTVEANLRAIVGKAKAAKAEVLLLGVSSEPDRSVERTAGVAYARELAAVYPRIAAELSVTFVPFLQGVAGRRELTLPDGLHPTPEGHERVASHLLAPLRTLLEQ